MGKLKIDFYTDIGCPWCLIGGRRLDNVLARFAGLEADVEHHPVIIDPSIPREGIYMPDILLKRYGITDPSAAWQAPEAEARAAGVNLQLAKQPNCYASVHAHTLIRHARKLGTQHELGRAVIEAYFLGGENIADAKVLSELGARFGFAKEEVERLVNDEAELEITRKLAAQSGARGVTSVPHFIFNGRIALRGAPEEDIAAAIRRATADAA